MERASAWRLAGAFMLAIGCFLLASWHPWFAGGMIGFACCLIWLTELLQPKSTFYLGWLLGTILYAIHLRFFWNLFGPAALCLWMILGCWLAFFMLWSHWWNKRYHGLIASLGCAAIWMVLEYVRGELYYLRFTWATPGLALSFSPGVARFGWIGVYGIGFVCFFLGGICLWVKPSWRIPSLLVLMLGVSLMANFPVPPSGALQEKTPAIRIAGLHIENPASNEGLGILDDWMKAHPDTELILLSEYAFYGPPPDTLLQWCREQAVYLVAGGTQPLTDEQYRNTAFVISPEGKSVFTQAKSVPIQFFQDGLPADRQTLWASPWGPIGICICYDLSYTRVTDALIAHGARMLLVPTLDELHWGSSQHRLHARVAPMRAAEYGVPVLRVGSCGISQAVDASGQVQASTTFPGINAQFGTTLALPKQGHLPADRFLVWIAATFLAMMEVRDCLMKRRKSGCAETPQISFPSVNA